LTTLFGRMILYPQCADRNVCQLSCSDFYPRCSKVTWMEFYPTSDVEDQNVYSSVCVQRWYENPNQSPFFRNGIMGALLKYNSSFTVGNDFTTFQAFETLAETELKSQNFYNPTMALINWAKLYRSFKKVCQMNAQWATQLDAKLDALEAGPAPGEVSSINDIRVKAKGYETAFFAQTETVTCGPPPTITMMGRKIALPDFCVIFNIWKTSARSKYAQVKEGIRQELKNEIQNDDAPLCECSGFDKHYAFANSFNTRFCVDGGTVLMPSIHIGFFTLPEIKLPKMCFSTPNYLNNLYPPRKEASRQACHKLCYGN